MSAARRVVAVVVAVLVVVIAGVVLLSGADGPIGRGPAVSASPSAAASASPTAGETAEPTETAAGTPVDEEDVRAVLEEIEEQVVEIRGLPPADIGPAELITRDELQAELEQLFEAEYPAEDRERDNFTLQAFGLLGPDEDVGELQLELLSSQVVGFYDDTEQRMVVVSDTGLDANAKVTYAHEYTHALQDAAFGLATLETDAVGEDDRGLARVSLIEGDATLTMLAWALQHLEQSELAEIAQTPVPDTGDVPDWMISQLTFPYVAGQEWIVTMMSEAGSDPFFAPDFEPVDAAFEDPPDSTAQILDYDKWADRVQPVDVDLPDLAGALGADWEEVSASSVGQATTGIILEHFGTSGLDVEEATDGWAGDRAVVARGPDDALALAWVSVWETEDDAAEFEAAYAAVPDQLEFAAAVTRDGDRVLVVHASTDDLLRRTTEATR